MVMMIGGSCDDYDGDDSEDGDDDRGCDDDDNDDGGCDNDTIDSVCSDSIEDMVRMFK